MNSRDLEYIHPDDMPRRLDATTAEADHVLLVGILRPLNTPAPGVTPSFLTSDLRDARHAVIAARLSGQPLGHDHREAPAKSGRKPADPDAAPATVTIESEEMPEMESDVQEMMTEVFG